MSTKGYPRPTTSTKRLVSRIGILAITGSSNCLRNGVGARARRCGRDQRSQLVPDARGEDFEVGIGVFVGDHGQVELSRIRKRSYAERDIPNEGQYREDL